MINLCECKPGDGLVAKNGSFFFYAQFYPFAPYKHHIKRKLNYRGVWSVTDEGKHSIHEDCDIDIIEIIPQETPNFYFTTYEKIRLYK